MAAEQMQSCERVASAPADLEPRTSEDVVIDVVRWMIRLYLAPFLIVGWILIKIVILIWTVCAKLASVMRAVFRRPRVTQFNMLKRPRSRVLRMF
jgi:hypothetical protein